MVLKLQALGFGGYIGPVTGKTEEYNGTSWAEQNDLNTAGYDMGSAGTQTAGLGFGGYDSHTDLTEEYNGTSWTETNNLNTGRNTLAGAGTQTAGLAFGG